MRDINEELKYDISLNIEQIPISYLFKNPFK